MPFQLLMKRRKISLFALTLYLLIPQLSHGFAPDSVKISISELRMIQATIIHLEDVNELCDSLQREQKEMIFNQDQQIKVLNNDLELCDRQVNNLNKRFKKTKVKLFGGGASLAVLTFIVGFLIAK